MQLRVAELEKCNKNLNFERLIFWLKILNGIARTIGAKYIDSNTTLMRCT